MEFTPYYKEIIEKATNLYGKEKQKIVAIEELSELQKELTKDLRRKGNSYNIAEEMADVLIVWNELLDIYGNKEKVEMFLDYKLERLRQKVREDENK